MSIRRKPRTEQLAISEAELLTLTHNLDAMNRDVVTPRLDEAVADWNDHNSQLLAQADGARRSSRRTFLLGTGAAAAGGLLLAACGSSSSSHASSSAAAGSSSSSSSGSSSSSATSGSYPASLTGDLKVVALATSLENLAVYAYTAGIKAAQAGKLGTVPPAVVTFATTARAQHEQHAGAWNAILTGSGKKAVTETDPALTPTVNQMFSKVTNVTGLAKLALTLETIAAETYQAGVDSLSSTKGIATAASIEPVEMQHAAILNFVLGQYPVPNAFSPISQARTTSDLG